MPDRVCIGAEKALQPPLNGGSIKNALVYKIKPPVIELEWVRQPH